MKGRQFALTTMGADRWPLYVWRLLAAAILLGAMGAAGFVWRSGGRPRRRFVATAENCSSTAVSRRCTLALWRDCLQLAFLYDRFYGAQRLSERMVGRLSERQRFLDADSDPAGPQVITATLQLWVQIDTQEPDNAAALDLLTLEVRDMAGALFEDCGYAQQSRS